MTRVYLHKETGTVIFADHFFNIVEEIKKEKPSTGRIKARLAEHERMLVLNFELVDCEEAIMYISQNILSKEQQEKIEEVIKQTICNHSSELC
jgi:hypothetical protein